MDGPWSGEGFMSEELRDKAISLLVDALEIDAMSAVTARLGETKGWDSIAHMRLIMAIEEFTGRQLDPETIVSLMSIDDVIDALGKHGVSTP